ncbi:DUF2341 domain-containing protein [bacterium]|nr:DUF2341 domain-containing protein [bacterium]
MSEEEYLEYYRRRRGLGVYLKWLPTPPGEMLPPGVEELPAGLPSRKVAEFLRRITICNKLNALLVRALRTEVSVWKYLELLKSLSFDSRLRKGLGVVRNLSSVFTIGRAGEKDVLITNNAGIDLIEYSVLIELTSENFDDWDVVNEDGSDIYFTSENGSPLYYWIEVFSKTDQYAKIWVKIPLISASGSTTIKLKYGKENPFPNYRNPKQVFLVYSTFDSDLEGWEYYGCSGYHASLDLSEGNPPPSVHISGDDFACNAGIRKLVEKEESVGLAVELDYRAKSRYRGSTVTNARVQFMDEAGNKITEVALVAGGTYDTGWDHGIVKKYTELQGYTKVYVYLNLRDGWSANWNQENWYDNVIVRKYVEPEPTVSILS